MTECEMYLKNEVFPLFKSHVESMSEPLHRDLAQSKGADFIKKNICPVKAETRGCIYDFFGSISHGISFVPMFVDINNPHNQMVINNMEMLAKGITWAIQHDGFDKVKCEPIGDHYGYDIEHVE